MTPHRLVLVLGGTRSGKSALAERLAAEAGGEVRYLATAPSGQHGDHARIAAHRARRPASWETVEVAAAQDLTRPLHDAGGATVLLDGLGTWLAGVLHDAGLLDDDGTGEDPADAIDGASAIASVGHAIEALAAAATARDGLTIVVGEESGMAPVAADRGTRRWVDLVGTAHQTLAARADRVLLVVAGRAIELPPSAALEPEPPAQATLALGDALSAPRAVAADAARSASTRVASPPSADASSAEDAEGAEDSGNAGAGGSADGDREDGSPTDGDRPGHGAPGGGAADGRPADGDAPAVTPASPPAPDAPPLRDALPVPPGARLHGDRMVPDGMIDFAVNVVEGDPPGWARQALQGGLDLLGRYPDDRPAAHALATRHGRPPAGVLPLGGAVEGFWRLAFAVRPRRAAVIVPGFTEAEAALRTVGAEIVRVPREAGDDWALNPEAVPEDCDFVVLGRPENPTGVLDPREVVLRLRRPGRTVLVDEAFGDFVTGERPADGALADERPADAGPGDLVVLRSLTKALSVPGVRCGYLLGDPELVGRVRDAGAPWTCPTPSLELLRAYAERPDACGRIAARTAAHRGDLVARLRQLAGVQVWDGAANFVLARVPHGVDAVAGLHGHGIAVRPCTTFAGLDDRYVRIAVRTPALHARLTAALAAVISAAEREG